MRLKIKTLKSEKIDEDQHKTEELINLIQNGEFQITKSSWADVIKQNTVEPLTIEPEEANQNNLATNNLLAQKVSPDDLNVSISSDKTRKLGAYHNRKFFTKVERKKCVINVIRLVTCPNQDLN